MIPLGLLAALSTGLSKLCGAVHEGSLPQGTLGCLLHPPTTPCSGPTTSPTHYSNSFPASLLYRPPRLSEGPHRICVASSHAPLAPPLPTSILTSPCYLPLNYMLERTWRVHNKKTRTASTGSQIMWVYSCLPLSLTCPLTSSSGGRVWSLNCGTSGFLSCTIPPFTDSLFPGLSLKHRSPGHPLSRAPQHSPSLALVLQ